MSRPPRDPKMKLANPVAVRQWAIYGGALFLVTLLALLLGPGTLLGDQPSVPMTMAFVVMAFGTILSGLVLRHDPESGFTAPILGAVRTLSIPVLITVLAVETAVMQRLLSTTSLSGGQWLASIGLALVVPLVIELSKIPRRRALAMPTALDTDSAVSPARARRAAGPTSRDRQAAGVASR